MIHSPARLPCWIIAASSAAVIGASHGRDATAKLNRCHAQASKAQISARPDHAKAVAGSHRDSHPKVK